MILTIWAFIYLVVSMIFLLPFGTLAMIFYFFGSRKLMSLFTYRIAQGWALLFLKVTGCSVTVTGRENIPKKGGVCFVSNHDGFFDILLMLGYCNRPFGFVAKKELAFMPLLNIWIYLLGGLFINRSDVRKASRTISKGIARIKAGAGMIIFPEGHRSKGRGLLPFHPGALKLATQAEAPIVPVAISGSSNAYEKTSLVVSSQMKMFFCEVINTAELPSSDRKLILSDKVFTVIKEKLEQA